MLLLPLIVKAIKQKVGNLNEYFRLFLLKGIDTCNVIGYNISMIKSFKHKGLEKFFLTGSTKGIQSIHSQKLARILTALNNAKYIDDLNIPSFNLHKLKGEMNE